MSWDWATEIRERHFGPPLPGGYRLERVDEGTYWDRHEAELREHVTMHPDHRGRGLYAELLARALGVPQRTRGDGRHAVRRRHRPLRAARGAVRR